LVSLSKKDFNTNRDIANYRSSLYTKKIGSKNQVKVKAISLQAWTGPGGSRRVRLPDFKTIGT